VLHEIARRLQNVLRPGNVAARYGGEEFTVILAGATIGETRAEGERLR
jgi:two-component system, cell cycle response regulator